MRLIYFLLLAFALPAAPAYADVAGRYETIDENAFLRMEMTVEVDDAGNMRIQMVGMQGFHLLRDGEAFLVLEGLEGPVVMRVADTLTVSMESVERMWLGSVSTNTVSSVPQFNLEPMGEELVGGRTGTAYGLAGGEGSAPVYAVIVVSSDPALAPIGKALNIMQESKIGGIGPVSIIQHSMNVDMRAVIAGSAPLRMMDLELTDVAFETIPAERFSLPAKPLTLEELRRLAQPASPPPTLPARDD